MAVQSPGMVEQDVWTLRRSETGLWHWARHNGSQSPAGFLRLSDCLADAQAQGYDPSLHLLRLEPVTS